MHLGSVPQLWPTAYKSSEPPQRCPAQLLAALLQLLGPQLPVSCLRALEVALCRRQAQGDVAPYTSWRRLAAAYESSGFVPGLPELARSLVVLG